MSQQRIRYVKEVDGSLRSGQYIKAGDGTEFVCGLSPNGLTGYVASVSKTDPLLVRLAATSSHKTKMAIKKALEELGCSFTKETRGKNG